MAFKDIICPLTLTSFDSSSLTGAYQAINPAGFPHACSYIKISNLSDFYVDISYDGIQGHEIVAPHTRVVLYAQASSRTSNHVAMLKEGDSVYVMDGGGGFKGGYIYLSGWYLII